MSDRLGSEAQGAEPGLYFAEVTIRNRKGLHARASAQFVKCAETFDAQVRVTREGRQWEAGLYSHVFSEEHRAAAP